MILLLVTGYWLLSAFAATLAKATVAKGGIGG